MEFHLNDLAEDHPDYTGEVSYVDDHQKQLKNLETVSNVEEKVDIILINVYISLKRWIDLNFPHD
jgi:hypothetical protein